MIYSTPQELQKRQETAKGPFPTADEELRYSLNTERKSLKALYSMQVLEVQHMSHHHVTILSNTFVFYYLPALICPFLSGQRPVKAACYSRTDLFTQTGWY